jgi:hypothetical protein
MPCGLLNVAGYFDPLLALLDHAVAERFVRPEHRALLLEATEPERLIRLMEQYRAPELQKWIDRDER